MSGGFSMSHGSCSQWHHLGLWSHRWLTYSANYSRRGHNISGVRTMQRSYRLRPLTLLRCGSNAFNAKWSLCASYGGWCVANSLSRPRYASISRYRYRNLTHCLPARRRGGTSQTS